MIKEYLNLWNYCSQYNSELRKLIIKNFQSREFVIACITQRFKLYHLLKNIFGDRNKILNNENERAYRDKIYTLSSIDNLNFFLKSNTLSREDLINLTKYNGRIFYHFRERFHNDFEMVLTAVENEGWVIKYADDEIRDDEKIVMAAIKSDGSALRYVNSRFQDNIELVQQAIIQDAENFKFASERIKCDKKILSNLVKFNPKIINYACPKIRQDRLLLLHAIELEPSIMQNISPILKNDRNFILDAVKRNAETFIYLNSIFKRDLEILIIVLSKNGLLLEHVHEYVKNNIIICKCAVENNIDAIKFIPDSAFQDKSLEKYRDYSPINYTTKIGTDYSLEKYTIIKPLLDPKQLYFNLFDIKFEKEITTVNNIIDKIINSVELAYLAEVKLHV